MMDTLQGLRILNTRPKNQAWVFSQQIAELGGIAIECPTLEITTSKVPWIPTLPDLNQVSQAIFISPNAVSYCFTSLQQHHIHWPASIQVIAIGHGSAKALQEFHIPVHSIPDTPDSEHLLKLPILQSINKQTVLLFKGEGGREHLETGLLQRGANLIVQNVYKRKIPQMNRNVIHSLWKEDLVDLILLTSEFSIQNLFLLFEKEAHSWLQEKPCLVVSDRLAKSATSFGIKTILVSRPDWIIRTLLAYYNKHYEGSCHGQPQ